MARRRLTPGQRKELREARLMTLIGVVFVAAGGWGISQGSVGLGVTAVVFFGACLLWGVLNWRMTVVEVNGQVSESTDKKFVSAAMGIAVLLGLGCLAAFVFALTSWEQVGFATTALFPRAAVLVCGAVGTVFFIGGAIVMFVRGDRSKENSEDEDP